MYKPAEPKRRQFFKIATAGTVATAAGGLPMMFVPNAALAEEVLGSNTFTVFNFGVVRTAVMPASTFKFLARL